MLSPTPSSTFFPYTTLFRSIGEIHGVARSDYHDHHKNYEWNKRQGPHVGDVRPLTDYKVGHPPHVGLRSEEHTSELQSRGHLVCRLLLEKKTRKQTNDSGRR